MATDVVAVKDRKTTTTMAKCFQDVFNTINFPVLDKFWGGITNNCG